MVERRIYELESSVKAIARHMKKEIHRLEEMNKDISGLDRVDAKLHRKITDLENEIERLKKTDRTIDRSVRKDEEEIVAEIDKVSEKFNSLFEKDIQKIGQVNERLKEVAASLDRTDSRSQNERQKLHDYINDHKMSINEIRDEIKGIKDNLHGHSGSLSELKSSLRDTIRKEIRDHENIKMITKFMEDFDSYVTNDLKKATAMNCKIDILTKELANVEESLKQEREKHAKQKASLDRHVDNLQTDVDSLLKLKESFGQTIEEEDVERVSIEKDYQTIKDKQHELGEKMNEFKKTLDRQHRFIDDASKKLKTVALKYLGSELDKFTKNLDNRLPDLVTQRDFDLFKKELDREVSTIEKPDVSYLEIKINELERKLTQMYDMVSSIGDRIPVVVE